MVTDLQEFFLRSDPLEEFETLRGVNGTKNSPKNGAAQRFL